MTSGREPKLRRLHVDLSRRRPTCGAGLLVLGTSSSTPFARAEARPCPLLFRSCETFGALSTLRDRYAAQARTRPRPPRRSSGGDLFVCRYLVHDSRIESPAARLVAADRRGPTTGTGPDVSGSSTELRRAARLSVAPSGTSDRHSAKSRIAPFRLGFRLRGVQP